MTALRTYANLWTLWDHPVSGVGEWTLEEKIGAIAAAGFDGVMGEPGAGLGGLARTQGLAFIAFRRLGEEHDLAFECARCREEAAVVLQVHLGWHDTPLATATRLAVDLVRAAEAENLPVVIETHRDTCTETPEKTDALRESFRQAYPGRELPLIWDFSHPAVVKHLSPPFSVRLLTDRETVRRSIWHHLRPFNGHHCQVPVMDGSGQLTPECLEWLQFAGEVLAVVHNGDLAEAWVCPEIGPVRGGYGLSGNPPAWKQAVRLRQILVDLWDRPHVSPPL